MNKTTCKHIECIKESSDQLKKDLVKNKYELLQPKRTVGAHEGADKDALRILGFDLLKMR